MKTKPNRKTFKPDTLNWCELDAIGTFLVQNRKDFREHIQTFGYLEGESKIMADHIANKIFNQMLNIDPNSNRNRYNSNK